MAEIFICSDANGRNLMDNLFDSKTPEQFFWALRSEILTPLLVIKGYSNLMQGDIASKGVDINEVIKGIKAIEDSANKIHELLDEMADALRK